MIPDPKPARRIRDAEILRILHTDRNKECALTGWTDDLELHHCLPRSSGGDDVRSNLVFLRRDVHRRITANDPATIRLLGEHIVNERPDTMEYLRWKLGAQAADWMRRRLLIEGDTMSEPGTDLVLPHSGELISLGDAAACVRALDELRDLEYRIKELKAMLTDAIQDESRRQGTKTLTLNGGIQALVKGGEKILWDAQLLEAGLRAAGMGEERLRQIVVEEVSYSVQAVEAKRAAAANPDYADAVEAARTVVAARPTITVKRL